MSEQIVNITRKGINYVATLRNMADWDSGKNIGVEDPDIKVVAKSVDEYLKSNKINAGISIIPGPAPNPNFNKTRKELNQEVQDRVENIKKGVEEQELPDRESNEIPLPAPPITEDDDELLGKTVAKAFDKVVDIPPIVEGSKVLAKSKRKRKPKAIREDLTGDPTPEEILD